jgi:hypothetical protein
MFRINEKAKWADEVHGWDINDFVEGGPNGIDNIPIMELADRTVYLKNQVEALNDHGGYLTAYDFRKANPTQDELTTYALQQIGETDPLLIWNGTRIKNMFNGHIWILNNTPDSDPAIFEWVDIGSNAEIEELESKILERHFPIGSSYIQELNDPDPIEKGLPGHWELWTGKAEAYRLTSSALPAFTTYTPGANYAANAYVLWHLPGAGYELFKAKAAINNAAAQLDPILFDKYTTGDIIERRHLQDWLDDDLAVGATIAGGEHAGKKVSEVIALGGTFPSWEGGNRPTFKSGGVAKRRDQEFYGRYPL